ncbi:hypothetical protein BDN72DRAFT_880930 [Pluteus cervinus]|uniref:Uncharacterized protein n=1 Tax=Pluteus cervinus TaxID=181527 RepID=A0ACD3AIF3_9AGAR|nr:hypothetical protein BDN72DRAFT_880930 [Pluteus cervinus]
MATRLLNEYTTTFGARQAGINSLNLDMLLRTLNTEVNQPPGTKQRRKFASSTCKSTSPFTSALLWDPFARWPNSWRDLKLEDTTRSGSQSYLKYWTNKNHRKDNNPFAVTWVISTLSTLHKPRRRNRTHKVASISTSKSLLAPVRIQTATTTYSAYAELQESRVLVRREGVLSQSRLPDQSLSIIAQYRHIHGSPTHILQDYIFCIHYLENVSTQNIGKTNSPPCTDWTSPPPWSIPAKRIPALRYSLLGDWMLQGISCMSRRLPALIPIAKGLVVEL